MVTAGRACCGHVFTLEALPFLDIRPASVLMWLSFVDGAPPNVYHATPYTNIIAPRFYRSR